MGYVRVAWLLWIKEDTQSSITLEQDLVHYTIISLLLLMFILFPLIVIRSFNTICMQGF